LSICTLVSWVIAILFWNALPKNIFSRVFPMFSYSSFIGPRVYFFPVMLLNSYLCFLNVKINNYVGDFILVVKNIFTKTHTTLRQFYILGKIFIIWFLSLINNDKNMWRCSNI
jgi:hypothetical protein